MLSKADPGHRCAIQFLFDTGVRMGELRGLQWADVDWNSSRVIVRRQLSGLTGELTQPKTQKGTRCIALTASMIAALKRQKLAAGSSEFVFPGAGRAELPLTRLAPCPAPRRSACDPGSRRSTYLRQPSHRGWGGRRRGRGRPRALEADRHAQHLRAHL
jgi:integrase